MTRMWGLVVLVALWALACLPASAGAWSTKCCLPWKPPNQLVVSPDGRFAYSASTDITLALARDAETGALRTIDSYDFGGGPMALSPDGRWLYLAVSDGPRIVVFARDPETGLLTMRSVWGNSASNPFADIQISNDGRQLYASDRTRDALIVLDTDAGGGLAQRAEITPSGAAADDMHAPGPLTLSDDDSFLYAGSTTTGAVVTYSRATDGSLTFSSDSTCRCGFGDLALAPDGTRLFGDASILTAVARDPRSGSLAGPTTEGADGSGSAPRLADDGFALTPSANGMWVADGARLAQYSYGPSGFTFVRSYHNGVDGQGLREPRAVVLSPDGRNVYVVSGLETSMGAGRIGVFRRDPSTDRLSFVTMFEGPRFDGRSTADPSPVAVQIDGGAEFTNDPEVQLTIGDLGGQRGAFGFDVDNDGGFGAGMKHFTVSAPVATYSWTLVTTGPERLPKSVYVRLYGVVGATGRILTDDIVLDQRPPAIEVAKLSGRRQVRLRAHDGTSGLEAMQVTRRRARPGAWKPYKATAAVPRGHGAIWVRVRDRARNSSRWRRAAAGRTW